MNYTESSLEAEREAILARQEAASPLEPQAQRRRELATKVFDYADAFLEKLPGMPGFVPGGEHTEVPLQLSEEPQSLEPLLQQLGATVDHFGINPASGAHLGYIPGGGVYPASLGDYLADVFNRYSGINFASPAAVELERQLVTWMTGLVGYGEHAAGDLTSGGSIANLSAIVTAREAHNIRAADVPINCIYYTAQMHHCLTKAIGIAGLTEVQHRIVPMDAFHRMDAAALEQQIIEDRRLGLRPWLVIGSAGTTDTGAVDPLDRLAGIADRESMWLHVDGAYGAAFLLCEEGRRKLQGIERADSIVMDPHKGLFLPYGSGAVLVREGHLLAKAFAYEANYMQDAVASESRPSPASLSPELTRPFRGLRLWLPLRICGLAAFRACVEEKLMLARYFHRRIAALPGFEAGPEPDLSVVTYRYVPEHGDTDDFNRRLVAAIQQDGELFISSTMLDGRFVLRLAVLSFRTHLNHIERLLELLQENAARLQCEGRV
ncbi:MAG: amino acid decarboxylase [Gammaproteobacteria bacterium]|nr:amino acid decarboxylase [Gammaproteobacteria bacterium]